MALNISDAAEAVLEGQAVHREWVDEFMAGWFRPLQMMMMGAMLRSLPPEVLDQLDPADVELLMKEQEV